jgi:hypothetical protein
MIRLAEVCFCTEDAIDQTVACILRAVVISDRHSHVTGIAAQSGDQGLPERRGGFAGNGLDPHIPGLSFYRDSECSSPTRRVGGVDLPVPWLFPRLDMSRAFRDENPIGDTESGVFAISAGQTFAMSFGQPRDQLPGLEIDPLVDGLMADGGHVAIAPESSGDLLG